VPFVRLSGRWLNRGVFAALPASRWIRWLHPAAARPRGRAVPSRRRRARDRSSARLSPSMPGVRSFC